MRGTIGETLDRLILLQIGAAAATRDRVQGIVDSLVEQGRIQREPACGDHAAAGIQGARSAAR